VELLKGKRITMMGDSLTQLVVNGILGIIDLNVESKALLVNLLVWALL
jgi:hypothetical protein